MTETTARWHRELEIFCRIKPLIVLENNVLDMFQYPRDSAIARGSILSLTSYLHYFFKDMGYEQIMLYDHIRGFYNNCESGYTERFSQLVSMPVTGNAIPAPFKNGRTVPAPAIIRQALAQREQSAVIIMNFASRCITAADRMDQSEIDSFMQLEQAGLEAQDVTTGAGTVKNLCILIVNKVNDLPTWFYLQDPNLKVITIPTPTREEREQFVKGPSFQSFFARDIRQRDMPYYDEHPAELAKLQDRFVALTEGMSFIELNGLRRLCKNERYAVGDFCDVIDLFKYGIRENPWKALRWEEFRDSRQKLEARVKGQSVAIEKTLDILKRAMTGLNGLQHSSHMKPKGVMFFAGPTGTGKTETAKALAELVFGDEGACIRFDMSEYSQSHSDQRLLGAPPGYVGYEAGGQLTNAVRAHPFSILLFDEIEKAHPSIMDKFLQILEDGRMTDGQGNTVYFSECIIIFTSNLGIYTEDPTGRRTANVTADMPYAQVQQQVRGAIESYFKLELGRPEILNRIGENIVVFDFIRPEVARAILDAQIQKIVAALQEEKRVALRLEDAARETLLARVLQNLDNGGRGIGNIIESMLINPLARYLFEHPQADSVTIDAIVCVDDLVSLVIQGE